MTMKLITVCERHEIEEIIGKEIKRAYDLYPLGFEATVEIKSEVAGIYGLPHCVDLKVKVCPTPREPDSSKAGVLSLPDVVKSESNLPA
jgi:hypothetical protein